MFGLTFVAPEKRKISYAASMGSVQAAVGKEALFREILSGLDAISVREASARAFLQPLTDKPVTVVLDPTLLLGSAEWAALATQPRTQEPYVFSYFLWEGENTHAAQLRHIADQAQCPLLCIADEGDRYLRPGDTQVWDAGPKEFLGYIQNSALVLTNSFHGMVFSVLFHRPFWVFKRHRDGDTASMNGRILDFLADFSLEDRLIEDDTYPTPEQLARPIDYERVDRILAEKRSFSLHWLETALEGETVQQK